MAEILLMKDHRPRWARRERQSANGAEILLFTGVRYERYGASPWPGEVHGYPALPSPPPRLALPVHEPFSG